MEIFKNKFISLILAFVLGGATTYFVTDYIRLKNNEVVSSSKAHNNLITKGSKPKVSQNKMLKQDDSNDPFAQMDKIHDQMQKRMNKVFGNSMLGSGMLGGSLFDNSFFDNNSFGGMTSDGLKVEEHEDDEFKYVEVIADGIDKNSININISDGMISISGEIRKTDDNQSANSRSMSSFISSFNRSFNIPYGVSEENVKIDTKENKIVIKFPKERV